MIEFLIWLWILVAIILYLIYVIHELYLYIFKDHIDYDYPIDDWKTHWYMIQLSGSWPVPVGLAIVAVFYDSIDRHFK